MKYLIGNHKMNLNQKYLKKYLKDLKKISKITSNKVGVCLPYVYLPLAEKFLKNSNVMFGCQNMFYEDKGAFTGEISANMLKDFNAQLVIIGHSERRQIFGESDEIINKKIVKALSTNLNPILCVGETLEQRNAEQTKIVLKQQIIKCLMGVSKYDLNKLIFAYEPVWAIGTGKSASFAEAEDAIKYIKDVVCDLYDIKEPSDIIVLYGGSLNGKNVNELLSSSYIDGGLIGGASLKIDEFKPLINYK